VGLKQEFEKSTRRTGGLGAWGHTVRCESGNLAEGYCGVLHRHVIEKWNRQEKLWALTNCDPVSSLTQPGDIYWRAPRGGMRGGSHAEGKRGDALMIRPQKGFHVQSREWDSCFGGNPKVMAGPLRL